MKTQDNWQNYFTNQIWELIEAEKERVHKMGKIGRKFGTSVPFPDNGKNMLRKNSIKDAPCTFKVGF